MAGGRCISMPSGLACLILAATIDVDATDRSLEASAAMGREIGAEGASGDDLEVVFVYIK